MVSVEEARRELARRELVRRREARGERTDDLIAPAPAPNLPPPSAGGGNRGSILSPIVQGATFGFADEIAGGVRGAYRAATEGVPLSDAYVQERDRSRAMTETARRDMPIASTVAEIGGAIVPAIATGGLGLAARGTGMMPRALGAGAEGAIAGGVYGVGSGEGSVSDQANNAMWSAGVGAMGGAAAPAIGRAVGAVAAPVVAAVQSRVPQVAGASRGAVKRVLSGFEDDVLQTPADLSLRRAEVGPDARLYNAGENLRTQAETLVQRPGAQMRTLTAAAKEQTTNSGSRVRSALDGALGRAEDVTKAFDDAVSARKAKANTLYGQAFREAKPVNVNRVVDEIDEMVMPPELGTDLRDDSTSATLRRVRDFFATGQNQRYGIQSLHAVKQELDGMIGTATRAGDNPKAAALLKVQRQLLSAMDEASPSYATARREFAGDIAVENALEAGQGVFARTLTPAELAKEYGAMSQAERLAFKKGARDSVEQMMDNALPNLADNADAQAAWKRLGTDAAKRKMEILLGPDAAKTIQTTLTREWKLSADAGTMLNNSATARRQAAREMFPDPNKAPAFPTAPSAYGRLESIVGGAAAKVGGKAMQSGNRRLNEDAARLLGLPIDSPVIDELMAARMRMSQGQIAGEQAAGLLGMLGQRSALAGGAGTSSTYNRAPLQVTVGRPR